MNMNIIQIKIYIQRKNKMDKIEHPDSHPARSLSYNDLKKRRMLRESHSKKKLQSINKASLTRSSTSTNLTCQSNKFIKEVPTNKEGMNEFIYELKDVVKHLEVHNYGSAKLQEKKIRSIVNIDSLKKRISGGRKEKSKFFSEVTKKVTTQNKENCGENVLQKTKKSSLHTPTHESSGFKQLKDLSISPIVLAQNYQNEKSELSLLTALKTQEASLRRQNSKAKMKIPRDFFKFK